MPRPEPFAATVQKVRERRAEAVRQLCDGRWDGEAGAREFVGTIKACTEILDEMKAIAGPGTNFGEIDL